MQSIYHAAHVRGNSDQGYLKANQSFSFTNYHNPDRINFGSLRLLNEYIIAPGMGFNTHSHVKMEIITIPLKGDL